MKRRNDREISALSRPVACVIAAVSTMISHLVVHLWAYGGGAEMHPPLRFFGPPAALLAVATALGTCWIMFALVRSRRQPEVETVRRFDTRSMLWYSTLTAVLLSIVATMSFVEFDSYGYWAVIVIVVGVPTVGFSIVLSVVLVLSLVAATRWLRAAL